MPVATWELFCQSWGRERWRDERNRGKMVDHIHATAFRPFHWRKVRRSYIHKPKKGSGCVRERVSRNIAGGSALNALVTVTGSGRYLMRLRLGAFSDLAPLFLEYVAQCPLNHLLISRKLYHYLPYLLLEVQEFTPTQLRQKFSRLLSRTPLPRHLVFSKVWPRKLGCMSQILAFYTSSWLSI